jgi:hypothetical protein
MRRIVMRIAPQEKVWKLNLTQLSLANTFHVLQSKFPAQ